MLVPFSARCGKEFMMSNGNSNKERTTVFFEDFPFLTKGDQPIIRRPKDVSEVAVKRMTEDFLLRVPLLRKREWAKYVSTLNNHHNDERILLLDKRGCIIAVVSQKVVMDDGSPVPYDGFPPILGESVSDTLLGVDPAQVHYAVLIHTGYELSSNSGVNCVSGYRVVLYKLSSDLPLKDWVEGRKTLARQSLEAEA